MIEVPQPHQPRAVPARWLPYMPPDARADVVVSGEELAQNSDPKGTVQPGSTLFGDESTGQPESLPRPSLPAPVWLGEPDEPPTEDQAPLDLSGVSSNDDSTTNDLPGESPTNGLRRFGWAPPAFSLGSSDSEPTTSDSAANGSQRLRWTPTLLLALALIVLTMIVSYATGRIQPPGAAPSSPATPTSSPQSGASPSRTSGWATGEATFPLDTDPPTVPDGEWQVVRPLYPYDIHVPYAVGKDFYFFGDASDADRAAGLRFYRFEPESYNWTELAGLPYVEGYQRATTAAWGDDALLVVMEPSSWYAAPTGEQESVIVLIYEVGTDMWTQVPPVSAPSAAHSLAGSLGWMLPGGGAVGYTQVIPNGESFYLTFTFGVSTNVDLGIWRYDLATGGWSAPFKGLDAYFAKLEGNRLISRSAGLSDGRLVFRASDASGSRQGMEWANPQTGALEEFKLWTFPVTGEQGAPYLPYCYDVVYGGGSNLWTCFESDPNWSFATTVCTFDGSVSLSCEDYKQTFGRFIGADVFDFVDDELVYLGHFDAQFRCQEDCITGMVVPGDIVFLGGELLDPRTGASNRIPWPAGMSVRSAVAFTSTAMLACTNDRPSVCGLYTFR